MVLERCPHCDGGFVVRERDGYGTCDHCLACGWLKSVGIDFHQGKHVVLCLDEGAQLCDSFSFQTRPEGLDTFEEHIFHDGSDNLAGLDY